MSIVRTSHNKDNPYVCLNKKALEDPKLSWSAKGLWAYLMSRPDNWKVSVAHLSKIYLQRGGKEDAIYRMLKELTEHGYCTKQQFRDEKGAFLEFEYIICEFKIVLPQPDKPDAGKPGLGKQGTNKYRSKKSNEAASKEDTPPPLPTASEQAIAHEEEKKLDKLLKFVKEKVLNLETPQILRWVKKYGLEYTRMTIAHCWKERKLFNKDSPAKYVQMALKEDYFNLKKGKTS